MDHLHPAMSTALASFGPRQEARLIYDNAEHMMEVLGGSFVKALVNLWYCADSSNKPRVRAAFPEYFERYEQMFREHCAKTGASHG